MFTIIVYNITLMFDCSKTTMMLSINVESEDGDEKDDTKRAIESLTSMESQNNHRRHQHITTLHSQPHSNFYLTRF